MIITSDIIITTESRLKQLMKEAIEEHEKAKKSTEPPKLYTINKVAKLTGKSHATIKKRVKEGKIETTHDGLITEEALNIYLKTR